MSWASGSFQFMNEKYNDIQYDGRDIRRINITCNEHPSCAIFKKTVSIENDIDKISTTAESYINLISRSKDILTNTNASIKQLKEIDSNIIEYQKLGNPNI